MATKLTERQRRFADEYLRNPNATQAAIAAGYATTAAAQQGHELMQHGGVKAYIAAKAAKAEVAVVADVERITRELAAIGFSDVSVLFEDSPQGPRLRPIGEWPQEIRVCIASIKTSRRVLDVVRTSPKDGRPNSGPLMPAEPDEQGELTTEAEIVTEIKLWPKVQSLELLARYRKMLDGGAGSIPADQRQTFVGLAVTVAPGATLNVQVNAPNGAKGES